MRAIHINALIATIMGLKSKNNLMTPDSHFTFHKRTSPQFALNLLGDKVMVPSGTQEWVFDALYFGHPGGTGR